MCARAPALRPEDADQWQLAGQVWENELPPGLLRELEANGHAFRELGG